MGKGVEDGGNRMNEHIKANFYNPRGCMGRNKATALASQES